MKNLNKILKVGVLLMFVVVAVSSCKKAEEATPSIYTPEREAGLIKDWLATMVRNNNNIDTTATGLFYILDTPGTGPTIQAGDSVKVIYTGYFTDGSFYESSTLYGDGTFSFMYIDPNPKKRMIKGWEEAMEVLNKGSKAIFLFPSEKAYGAEGNGLVPPYTPLVYVVEILNIKKNTL